jgi:hypothetical protein
MARYGPTIRQRKKIARDRLKAEPCGDCIAAGIRTPLGLGVWPSESMTIEHLPGYPKTMEMSEGSDKSKGNRTGGMRPYSDPMFTVAAVLRELEHCIPLCANHQNVRTRIQNLGRRGGMRSNLVRCGEQDTPDQLAQLW